MTDQEARTIVLERLADIAPDADVSSLRNDAALRDELDLDSMDALSLLEELSVAIGEDIPDRDAASLHTIDDLVAYLMARAASGSAR